MALATSGALTLDQIHVEAGGSTGTTCSFNDSDIRGLTAASGRTINSTLGTNIDFADFYGASGIAADVSTTLTVGHSSDTDTSDYVGTIRTRQRGFEAGPLTGQDGSVTSYGSLATTTFSSYFGGNAIARIKVFGTTFDSISNAISNPYTFQVATDTTGVANSNSSFKQVIVGSTTFNRSDATYTSSSASSFWRWNVSGTLPDNATSNAPPFGGNGSTITVTFKQA